MISNRIINFNNQFLKAVGGNVGFVVFAGDPRIAVKIGPYHISLDFSEVLERGYRLHIHHQHPMHRTLAKFIFRAAEPIALSIVELIRENGIVVLAGFDPIGQPRVVYHDTATGDYYMYLEEQEQLVPVVKDME